MGAKTLKHWETVLRSATFKYRAETWTLVFTVPHYWVPMHLSMKNDTYIGHAFKKSPERFWEHWKWEEVEGMPIIIISWRIFLSLFEMSTPLSPKGESRWVFPEGTKKAWSQRPSRCCTLTGCHMQSTYRRGKKYFKNAFYQQKNNEDEN